MRARNKEDYWTGVVKSAIYRSAKGAIETLTPITDVRPINELFQRLYLSFTPPAAKKQYRRLGRKDLQIPLDPSENIDWERIILNYVSSAPLARRIVGINKNTADIIERIILESLGQGLSTEQTQRALRAYFTSNNLEKDIPLSVRRARVIARTEMATAIESGSWLGAEQLSMEGYNIVKKWMATLDSRVRDDHASADGQTVGINQNFIVGGYPMSRPLDPSAPPEHVINCRCTVQYLLE